MRKYISINFDLVLHISTKCFYLKRTQKCFVKPIATVWKLMEWRKIDVFKKCKFSPIMGKRCLQSAWTKRHVGPLWRHNLTSFWCIHPSTRSANYGISFLHTTTLKIGFISSYVCNTMQASEPHNLIKNLILKWIWNLLNWQWIQSWNCKVVRF